MQTVKTDLEKLYRGKRKWIFLLACFFIFQLVLGTCVNEITSATAKEVENLNKEGKSPTKKSNHHSLFSTVKKHHQAIKETKIIEEFEVYIKEPVLPDGDAFSLLLYWKTNAHRFQCLSVIARDILCPSFLS